MIKTTRNLASLLCGLVFLAGGCGPLAPTPAEISQSELYLLPDTTDDQLSKLAPIFLIEENNRDYNRIGTPTVSTSESEDPEIYIDTEQATIYTMTQDFETTTGKYSNLIYRVHFPRTPFPHLTAGKNVGLLVYVTLNSAQEPVLITTLHTCGCYLSFIPTTKLAKRSWPEGWQENRQLVYGEELPGLIEQKDSQHRLIIHLRSDTHRVMDVSYAAPADYENITGRKMRQRPMAELDHLPTENKKTVSFFATEGLRKGLVKGSHKPLEMVLIGWLAADPFVGEDKALGPPAKTGTRLYTSLKFWARNCSNIWFFPRFLQYWGWNL